MPGRARARAAGSPTRDHIPVPTLDLHAVDRYLNVGPMLGLEDGTARFFFSDSAGGKRNRSRRCCTGMTSPAKPLVAMAPGTIWETKHWGTDKFAEVARHFLQKGFAVALIGARRERAVCDEVARLAPGSVDVAGETTLTELAALIRRSAICVTNDSGPMHLAVALGRPVVSVFGPTDPIWIGPYRRADAVLRAGVPCSPCLLRQLSRCRNDHGCMEKSPRPAVIERMERRARQRAGTGAATSAAKFSASSPASAP